MKLSIKDKAPARVTYGTVASPAGKLAIGLTDKGEICRVSFLRNLSLKETVNEWKAQWPRTQFVGGAKLAQKLTQPIALTGTRFQQTVWRVMSKIPSGSVTTYGEIARYIGKPGASRAVGAACGANPVPYLVPCHRVIAANGGLGGFSGGLDIKKKLLKAEGYLRSKG